MLLFCPCEHVEGVVDLPERAKQPGLRDDGGRSHRAGPQLFENRSCFAVTARRRERPPQDADKERRTPGPPRGARISYVPRRAPAVRVNGQTS